MWAVLSKTEVLATGRTTAAGLTIPAVALATGPACATACTTAAVMQAGEVFEADAAHACGFTSPARLTRDDTAEIARLIMLLPKAKRLTVTLPDDVVQIHDLIDRMKKKKAA